MKTKFYLKKIQFFFYVNDIIKYYKSNINFFFKKKKKLQFITVPRTGSTLLINLFNKFKLNIDWNNHYVKPKYFTNSNYIISIRNPLDRFISAFYHVKYNQKIYYHKNFFILYPEVDDLAKNINKKETKKYIRLCHHLNEGLSTFFKIEDIKKNPPLYIFEFLSLHRNIYYFLKDSNIVDKKKLNNFLSKVFGKSTNKKKLSKISERKLKLFLKQDFKIFNYLMKNKSKINSNFNTKHYLN